MAPASHPPAGVILSSRSLLQVSTAHRDALALPRIGPNTAEVPGSLSKIRGHGALLLCPLIACASPRGSLIDLLAFDGGHSDSGGSVGDGGGPPASGDATDGGVAGCNLIVQPVSVDFGEVPIGGGGIANLFLTNLGPNDCLVSNLGVSCEDDQGAFGPENGPIATQHLAAPEDDGSSFPTSVNFQVTFAPPSVGTYNCDSYFSFSPAPGGLSVPLTGRGIQ
jgi:hypothetical protein